MPVRVPVIASLLLLSSAIQAASPYPPSAVIADIQWDSGNVITEAPGSDLWPVTWGADGDLYTAFGDGGGFGGTNNDGRVSLGIAKMSGMPPNISYVNINGGKNSVNPPTWGCTDCGKTGGIISIDGVFYIWFNSQNAAKNYKLAWSNDNAVTWQYASWSFPEDNFWPRTFLHHGQDNNGAFDNYVYSYGYAKGNTNTTQYLMRVLKTNIKTRSAYEFFAGLDANNNPTWTSDITQRQPVLTDPAGMDTMTVSYNFGLQRYIATTSHDGTAGKLSVYDAPKPWGPWTTVAYYDNWLNHGSDQALMFTFPAKWMSADGLTMWMVYSSWPARDRFNLIKATLTLQGPPPAVPGTPQGSSLDITNTQ